MEQRILENDFGSFEGYNFRQMAAIYPNTSAQGVIDWDHDGKGEAEFWPDGDHDGVALVFRGASAVTAGDILALDRLISALGDEPESYVRIAWMIDQGECITGLEPETIEDELLFIHSGDSFLDVCKDAAFELFEAYWPDEYRAWEKSNVPGLEFDWERFLDGPEFSTGEYQLGDQKYIVVKSL